MAGVSHRVSYRAELDAWRIRRSDGTDVLFAMPRCALSLRATSSGDGERHGVSAPCFAPGRICSMTPLPSGFLASRGEAARLARVLPDAPTHPAGSFPLVIDYALAKGLAHEAFGHASEADGFRSSILAREGRFRCGDRVGAENVSIIDEPVADDHAWQPFSANGLRRLRATLVDRGRLADGLSDPWSAGPGGVKLTGAARAESFRSAPQPRMTNIRIEVADPLAAPGEFEDYGPEQVRDLLAGAGVFERHSSLAFLSGYTGGQVNTATGDFAFHCKAIYRLSADDVTLYQAGDVHRLDVRRAGVDPRSVRGRYGWTRSVTAESGASRCRPAEGATTSSYSIRIRACFSEGDRLELSPLLEALRTSRADGVGIRDWSIFASESQSFSLGVKDRQAGNAHTPVTLRGGCSGRYLIVWEDGLVSRGRLERRQIEQETAEALAYARAAAYDDPDAAQVPGPVSIPDVELHDAATAELAGGESELVARRLAHVRSAVAGGGLRTWSGSFQAGEVRSRLVNSAGVELSGRGTTLSWFRHARRRDRGRVRRAQGRAPGVVRAETRAVGGQCRPPAGAGQVDGRRDRSGPAAPSRGRALRAGNVAAPSRRRHGRPR